jgi:hypothetical protein
LKNAPLLDMDLPMAQKGTKPYIRVEVITPKIASEMLLANRRNRNLLSSRVARLAEAMERAEWELNGQTIKFDIEGNLLDGQHRLQAVIDSGCAIESLVVRGLPIAAQDTVDTGRKRRLADILRIEGFQDAHALAAGVNMLFRYQNRSRLDYSQEGAPSVKQAMRLIEDEPRITEGVSVARNLTREIGGPVGVFAALHCVFIKADPVSTPAFFVGLERGEDLGKGDPLLSLRKQLNRMRTERLYSQTPATVAGLTVKAFNMRRDGSKVAILTFRKGEKMPEVNPRKKRSAGKR